MSELPSPRVNLHGLLNGNARSPGLQTRALKRSQIWRAAVSKSSDFFAQAVEKVMATERRQPVFFGSASSFQVGHLSSSSLQHVVTFRKVSATGTLQNNNE